MNEILQACARKEIKIGWSQCTPKQQDFFKRIFDHCKLTANIDELVDGMPEEKLDSAMGIIERTLRSNEE